MKYEYRYIFDKGSKKPPCSECTEKRFVLTFAHSVTVTPPFFTQLPAVPKNLQKQN